MYERSFMHRDQITHVATTPRTDFIVTTSADGHLKFWKKTEKGVEFVKHFRGHLGGVCAMAVSGDGLLVATVSAADKSIKVYDVVNFGMLEWGEMLWWMSARADIRMNACTRTRTFTQT